MHYIFIIHLFLFGCIHAGILDYFSNPFFSNEPLYTNDDSFAQPLLGRHSLSNSDDDYFPTSPQPLLQRTRSSRSSRLTMIDKLSAMQKSIIKLVLGMPDAKQSLMDTLSIQGKSNLASHIPSYILAASKTKTMTGTYIGELLTVLKRLGSLNSGDIWRVLFELCGLAPTKLHGLMPFLIKSELFNPQELFRFVSTLVGEKNILTSKEWIEIIKLFPDESLTNLLSLLSTQKELDVESWKMILENLKMRRNLQPSILYSTIFSDLLQLDIPIYAWQPLLRLIPDNKKSIMNLAESAAKYHRMDVLVSIFMDSSQFPSISKDLNEIKNFIFDNHNEMKQKAHDGHSVIVDDIPMISTARPNRKIKEFTLDEYLGSRYVSLHKKGRECAFLLNLLVRKRGSFDSFEMNRMVQNLVQQRVMSPSDWTDFFTSLVNRNSGNTDELISTFKTLESTKSLVNPKVFKNRIFTPSKTPDAEKQNRFNLYDFWPKAGWSAFTPSQIPLQSVVNPSKKRF